MAPLKNHQFSKNRRHLKDTRIIVILSRGLENLAQSIKNHSFELLYAAFSFITHAYLLVIAFNFFFQKYIPPAFIRLADSLSEPYLGVIGIYLILKEVRIRVGKETPHKFLKEAFVMAWFLLLVVSSALTLYSKSYHVDEVYRLIITNSLASLIIRIGTWFRY